MAEIAARLPSESDRSRVLQLLALALGSALVVGGLLVLRRPPAAPVPPESAQQQAFAHPRQHEPFRELRSPRDRVAEAARRNTLDAGLAAAAARSFDRGIFTSSPGGVLATAARVARWRPLVLRATRGSGISPDVVEAMLFVESSGYRDAVAGPRAGLVQLTPWLARSLGLRVDRIDRRGRLLASARVRADERYRALPSLRAAVRHLERARRTLGRTDLAVASYHLGTANLGAATAGEPVSFASLYFGAAPDRNALVWTRLNRQGPVARDYYWKVLAAQRVLRLYRRNPSALAFEIRQQLRKNSSEELMHPRSQTPRYLRPSDVARAWKRGELQMIPRRPQVTHIAIGRGLAQMAPRLGRSRRLYRGLRPPALEVLLFIGKRVQQLSGARKPLVVTSAVRDEVYQRALRRVNPSAARTYSLHTTGYAFDIARAYSSRRQAAAFDYVLRRLEALNAIAYIRETGAMHIAVASRVSPALLRRAG